jgi:hypothetical protein
MRRPRQWLIIQKSESRNLDFCMTSLRLRYFRLRKFFATLMLSGFNGEVRLTANHPKNKIPNSFFLHFLAFRLHFA